MCIWKQSRWSLVEFIRAVCSKHIKYSLHTGISECSNACNTYSSAAHYQTERKTESMVNTCITCELPLPFWMTAKSAPFLSPSLFPFLLKIHFLSPFPCPYAHHFSSFFWLRAQTLLFSATWTPLLIFLPPSFFFFPPVRLLLCLMAFYSYVMVDGFM